MEMGWSDMAVQYNLLCAVGHNQVHSAVWLEWRSLETDI